MAGSAAPLSRLPLDGRGLRVAVAVGRYNEDVSRRLLRGALNALRRCRVVVTAADVVWVPGAWELPAAAQGLARTGRYDAIVCLGCVIRGETTHDRHVAAGATTGLMRVSLDAGMPVALGVLTTQTLEQAEARSGGNRGNKGEEAARSAVEMALLVRRLRGGRRRRAGASERRRAGTSGTPSMRSRA